MALGGVGRTPAQPRRTGRNWGKMQNNKGLVSGLALQIVGNKLVLVIATGEPLSQDANGLALELDGPSISKSADGIRLSEVQELKQAAQVAAAKQEVMAYTAALHSEAQAFAFFQGQM
jgi:hypothetical protein